MFHFWYCAKYTKPGVPWATRCLRAATLMPASSLCWASASHSSSKIPFSPQNLKDLNTYEIPAPLPDLGKALQKAACEVSWYVFCQKGKPFLSIPGRLDKGLHPTQVLLRPRQVSKLQTFLDTLFSTRRSALRLWVCSGLCKRMFCLRGVHSNTKV